MLSGSACCSTPLRFFFPLSYSLVSLGSTSLQNISTKSYKRKKELDSYGHSPVSKPPFSLVCFILQLEIQFEKQLAKAIHTLVFLSQMPSRRPPLSLSVSLNSPEGVMSLLCHNKDRKYVGGSSFCTDFNVYTNNKCKKTRKSCQRCHSDSHMQRLIVLMSVFPPVDSPTLPQLLTYLTPKS